MQEILVKACSFIAVIALGFLLRRVGMIKETDFTVISKIVIWITLPAAIITSFIGKEIEVSMLSLALIGFSGSIVYMVLAFLLNRRGGREQQAFEMLNCAGYNVGTVTLPFIQGFLGPVGVITASLFDMGNSVMCVGGAYSVASMVKEGGRFSFGKIAKRLATSMPFITYMVMTLVALLHLPVPSPVVSFAGILGNANTFMAMLMIGVGIKLPTQLPQLKQLLRMLNLRYGVAVVLALGCWFLLPFEADVRRTLVICMFSPMSASILAFNPELKSDVGLASTANSLSIMISILCFVGLLLIML